MSSCYEPLRPACVALNSEGTPVSPEFGDVYYAGSSPLEQARDVFLNGNQLPRRWRGRARFTVLETGFGLGHNFLALWQAWRSDPQRCEHLHFVSIEAHPFTRADLSMLLNRLQGPERHLAQKLTQAWPTLTPGLHRLEFDGGAVTLTLALGSISRLAKQLELGYDACFLDGFAPRVNPQMWTSQVFGQLARLANAGATLATWCSAGHVRRGLQDAGFLIERHTGFEGKRHQIRGRLRETMGRKVMSPVPRRVAVIGSGFAGAAVAQALATRGHEVRIFDPALTVGSSGTHRGHQRAAMTPELSRDDNVRSRLSRAGVMLARLRWKALDESARLRHCGMFEPVSSEHDQANWQRALQHLKFPAGFVRWVDPATAAVLSGVPGISSSGLWHDQGYCVNPERLLAALLESSRIKRYAIHVDRLEENHAGGWHLYNRSGERLAGTEVLVIANSWLARRLLSTVAGLKMPARLESLHRLAGQLSYFPTSRRLPNSIIAGDGLCMPGDKNRLIGGSTYVTDTTLSIITTQGHHENREKVANLLGDQAFQLGQPRNLADGWAGWRAAVRDRLPVIGAVPTTSGLWLACGFGSRGLTWSALAAELIATTLNHEPIPLERELIKKIAPL